MPRTEDDQMKPYKAPLNWSFMLAVLACVAFWVILAIALTSPASSQTMLRADQVLGGLPAPVASPEAQWCPGPTMTLESDRVLVIGPNWTDARPCYAHFNLIPPQGVDPINVSSFRAPARLELSAAAGEDLQDELYIYLSAPAFNGPTMTRPQRIIVVATQPGAITCTGCIIETAAPGQRIFPAFAMPVGMAAIVNGRFHPVLDSILDSKQLYIGADLGVRVRRDGPGLWIELSTTMAELPRIEAARTRATVSMLESMPPSRRMVQTVSSQLVDLQKQFEQIRAMLPPPDFLDVQKIEYQALRMEAARLHDEMRTMRATYTAPVEYIDFNSIAPGQPCSGRAFAARGPDLLTCAGGRWQSVRLED